MGSPPPRTLGGTWLHGLLRTLRRRCTMGVALRPSFLDLRPIRAEGPRPAAQANNKSCPTHLDAPSRGMSVSHAGGAGRPRGRTATARGFRPP
eukprot:6778828-Prymnesium_polylepis.1